MPFWRLYYHAAWVTKNREPAILDMMVEPMKEIVEETTRDLGVTVFAVGIMPDHVHVLAQIPPSLDVAAVIGRWKGATAHAANEHRPQTMPRLVWQPGYGVLSVSQHGFDHVRKPDGFSLRRSGTKLLYLTTPSNRSTYPSRIPNARSIGSGEDMSMPASRSATIGSTEPPARRKVR